MSKAGREIPVLINMASLASYDGIPDDPMQVVTMGTLTPAEGFYLLKYTESQEDEQTGAVQESEIQLILRKDQVTMHRRGDFSSTMLFQKNKRFETQYQTPYGELPMAIFAREVVCDLGEAKGKVHLKYELSMQGAYTSTNELHLEYFAKS